MFTIVLLNLLLSLLCWAIINRYNVIEKSLRISNSFQKGQRMPTISMFYGILVLMFFRDNRRHHLPHIHVRYQGEEAAISIDDGRILDGTMPAKQLKMVQAWI